MRKELVVGLVFLVAMVLLSVFTIVVSDFNPFAPTQRLSVRFDDIAGLQRGDAVQVAGAEMGKVKATTLHEGAILVELELRQPVELHEGYKIRIKSASPLGGRVVSIYQGDISRPKIPEDQPLVGNSYGADLMDSVYDLVTEIRDGEGTLAKLISDPEVYENVRDATRSFKNLGAGLEEGKGMVGKLLSEESETMYTDAAEAVRSFRQVATDISEGKGSLGKLVKDDTVYNNASEAFANIKELTGELKKGEGTAGRLIYDKEMGDDVRAIAEKVRQIATNVADGKGTLGKLVTDESLFNKANSMVAALDKLATSMANGEGTLGKLMTDSELHEEALKLVKNLREAVEDAREQAPISSFGSIILSGFR